MIYKVFFNSNLISCSSLDDGDRDFVHQVVDFLLEKYQNFLRDEEVGLVQILAEKKVKTNIESLSKRLLNSDLAQTLPFSP